MGGVTFDGISSTRQDSSNFSGTTVLASTGSFTDARVGTLVSTGAVQAGIVGSPAVFGAFIQAGKSGPLIAATGSLIFGRQFTDQTFVVVVSPSTSGTLPWSISSGTTTYTVSGITVNGQSGLSFHWTAVGI